MIERRKTREREEVEIAAVYLHRQYLIVITDQTVTARDTDELFEKSSSTKHWLLRRTGIANARRKQQFIYWKEHVTRLNEMRAKSSEQKVGEVNPITEDTAETPSQINLKPVIPEQTKLPVISISTTTATALKPGDFSPRGKKMEWPDPPRVDLIRGYFICHCKTLCPEKYLQKSAWIRIIADMRRIVWTQIESMGVDKNGSTMRASTHAHGTATNILKSLKLSRNIFNM
ncbi:uncharacterized protein TRIVIDRAFT_64862 [Trichoderma virens Gv29-8]|uniref:Uncharacterized protein n=1 Tax=Hypocrea virens (strain Gv29-8 / FGSC 10586) TaxID=413071 RepID=G9NBY9_HYPVG|nr:uncharacterized protein TRIVIDRAFT_64862 [Trichoderma virens Gv29-8]EHK15214.1 hypothetical protein TRIVIDRAFT_64862 [Trichoderma virens Gv29-8]UKZ51161.1 hypothetical protein TrVGV298_004917 [Trichoderma virens]